MVRMAAKLLVVLLALSVSPLHAVSVPAPPRPAAAPPASLTAALAALPAPLSEAAFFHAVNGVNAGVYTVGNAQGGTQAMVVTISITVPGDATGASLPPPGNPDTFVVDSFFDVFFDIDVPGVGPGGANDAPGSVTEVETEIVALELTSVDPTDIDERLWYNQYNLGSTSLTLNEASIPPAVLRSLDSVDTVVRRDGPDSPLVLNDDALGTGLFDLNGPPSICGADPGAPLCSQVGGIFSNGVDLLNRCAGSDSPICTELLSLDLMGAPGTHVIILDGFGDAAGDGLYTLQITESAVDMCNSDDPPAAECDGLLSFTGALLDFNRVCDGSTSELCDLNRPGDLDLSGLLGLYEPVRPAEGATEVDERARINPKSVESSGGDRDTDWYSFELENPPVFTIETSPPPAGAFDTEIWLFELQSFAPCGDDPLLANCGAAGQVFTGVSDLLETCSQQDSPACNLFSTLGPELPAPGDYTIFRVLYDDPLGAGSDLGPYTLHIDIDTVVTCTGAPQTPGCSQVIEIVDGIYDYNTGCDANPSPVCIDGALGLPEAGTALGDLFIANGSGEAGSILDDGPYRIRRAPDGHFLMRDGDGRVFTIARMPPMAPPDWVPSLIELTPDSSDPSKTVLAGDDGTRIVIPAPGVELVDINDNPAGIATTPEEMAAAASGEGAGLVGLITSTGGSTGAVFDIRLLNLGKPAVVEGDAIFEPLSSEEAGAVRNSLASLLGAANSVTNAPGTAYCVEQSKAVPSAGELFRLANTGKAQELAFAQQVLAGARAVEAAGLLNPDSDPTAYAHSTRQWGIWTVEKGYDKESFTRSFLEHTRKALEDAGAQWTPEIEDAVRGLLDNRWDDIQQVLEAAGLAPANAAAAVAAHAAPAASFALPLAGFIAAAAGFPMRSFRPGDR